jgi:hypothetical protein
MAVAAPGGTTNRQPTGQREVNRLCDVKPEVEPGMIRLREDDNKFPLVLHSTHH